MIEISDLEKLLKNNPSKTSVQSFIDKSETNYKNDSIIKGSIKYWNKRGLPTDRLGRPINNP